MSPDGRIEGISDGFLVGWAHDPEQPEARLELELELDGELLGRFVADERRPDLVREGIGDGQHAFRFKLPWPLEPGSEHVVAVRVCGDGVTLPLSATVAGTTSESGEPPVVLRAPGSKPQPPGYDGEWRDDRPARYAQAPLESNIPRALLGAEGWLFPYRAASAMARVLGAKPASPARVRSQVGVIETRAQHLKDLGAGFLLAALPSKAAVYAEHLPDGLDLAPEGRPADQLAAALREHSELEVLDLFGALRHAKRHGDVFLHRGQELTSMGAYYAYRAIAKELAKRFQAIDPPAGIAPVLGEPVDVSDPLASLERVTAIGRELVPVAAIDDFPDRDREVVRTAFGAMYVPLPHELAQRLGARAAVLERSGTAALPSAVVVHDGTAGRLIPFLAEHFARTLVDVADQVPYDVIESERPLVVIQIVSEYGPLLA